jgi:hypothetical protein
MSIACVVRNGIDKGLSIVFLRGDGIDETSLGNRLGRGGTMTQTALFWYLVIVLALGIILATMFITYKRIGSWRQAQEHKAENEPVVGTQREPTLGGNRFTPVLTLILWMKMGAGIWQEFLSKRKLPGTRLLARRPSACLM